MAKKKAASDVKVLVSAEVQACWQEYNKEDLNDPNREDKLVALRSKDDFYGVLCAYPEGEYYCIVFNYRGGAWEVLDDGIPFETIEQFQNEPIGPAFF